MASTQALARRAWLAVRHAGASPCSWVRLTQPGRAIFNAISPRAMSPTALQRSEEGNMFSLAIGGAGRWRVSGGREGRRIQEFPRLRGFQSSTPASPPPSSVREEEEEPSSSGPDADAYRRARFEEIRSQQSNEGSPDPFPHHFPVTLSVPAYVEMYSRLGEGEKLPESTERVAGRVMSLRRSGKALLFLDLLAEGERLQLMCDKRTFTGRHSLLFGEDGIRRGDCVGVTGYPGRNQKGELCLFPSDVVLLAPCFRLLPKTHYGLKDPDARYRNRHLDLLVNPQVREVFVQRSAIVRYLRSFFDRRGFIEVETPMLTREACGAAARPFVTTHNEMKSQMFLRVAPELYLKRLIVGGIDRVYEIGKCFRNEGVDATHNPEFTTVELYQAYADYSDLMEMTEELLQGVCLEIHGGTSFESLSAGGGSRTGEDSTKLRFQAPFARLDFMATIARESGMVMPAPGELETPAAIARMKGILKSVGVDHSQLKNAPQLLDKLSSHFVEPLCTQPTFITDYPLCMSPLAKEHRLIPGLSERFELFVLRRELANAYTELNDPREQRARFQQQSKLRDQGDEEAHQPDYNFCDALEQGMPPTAGWGLGVDRLCMLMLDQPSIREVQLFPTLRPLPAGGGGQIE